VSAVAVPTLEIPPQERQFRLKVLGRTLEHLGVQMYKRRDTAIAELVANCWDAGANAVAITLPDVQGYDPTNSTIIIEDDGGGMDPEAVQSDYLVIGRNRRADGAGRTGDRPVMGRKGIGKLAGFGIAEQMQLQTWNAGGTTTVNLDMSQLKLDANEVADVPLEGDVQEGTPEGAASGHGTRIELSRLKQKTAMDPDSLRQALARRFSRKVRGEMTITVNGGAVEEPDLALSMREPADGQAVVELEDNNEISYWFGFSEKVLRESELKGWTVLVRGKTAQAPGWFFNVESTASGQHGTKYFTGVIEADFLDDGDDDGTDIVSTDRQEIDWEHPKAAALLKWGAQKTRDALRERASQQGAKVVAYVYENPGLAERIERLEPATQERVKQYLKTLGAADPEDERLLELADALLRAFEYQHFHDVVGEIDAAGTESPEDLKKLLGYLHEWKVLESRAILEIVKGRLEIVDKLGALLMDGAPETAHVQGDNNLHDLLADYPWLIDPEWQVFAEEKRVTTVLREWNVETDPDPQRVDFLALSGEGEIKLIEIKRGTVQVSLAEVNRLDEYRTKLEQAEEKPIRSVLLYGGQFAFNYTRNDIELLTWQHIHDRARSHYEHYQAVLEGRSDDPAFARKIVEIQRTEEIARTGTTWRGPDLRAEGLGPQDVDHGADEIS